MDFWALVGGVMIGLAALALYVGIGRIAGVSGIYGRVFERDTESWRWFFLAGLAVAGVTAAGLGASSASTYDIGQMALAGLLVGSGTWIGNGCTSGHGVCGIGRMSKRSIVATIVFMGSAMLTVLLVGGAS